MNLIKQINLPASKAETMRLSATIKAAILSGDINPLEAYARLKSAEEAISEALKDYEVKQAIITEASAYPEKTFEAHGASWTKKAVGVKYDYSNCGDPVWNYIKINADKWNEKLKDREAFLKTIPPEGCEIVDDHTGEIPRLMPPAKTGSESLTCKLL